VRKNGRVVEDFMLLSQVNMSIYDYGSFAFWGAVFAGRQWILQIITNKRKIKKKHISSLYASLCMAKFLSDGE
jgi:hypothetical protein